MYSASCVILSKCDPLRVYSSSSAFSFCVPLLEFFFVERIMYVYVKAAGPVGLCMGGVAQGTCSARSKQLVL